MKERQSNVLVQISEMTILPIQCVIVIYFI